MTLKRLWHRLKWLFSADFPVGSVAVLEAEPEDVIVIECPATEMAPRTTDRLIDHLAGSGFKNAIVIKSYDGGASLRFTAIRRKISAIRAVDYGMGTPVDDERCNCGKPTEPHGPHPI